MRGKTQPSCARETTMRSLAAPGGDLMSRQLYTISQQSHLSRTPPIYRPLLDVPLSRLIYYNPLSAFAGCSAIPVNLLNRIIGPRRMRLCPHENTNLHYRALANS